MLDIQYIRDNAEAVKKAATAKGVKINVKALLALDADKRDLQHKIESSRQQKNQASLKISEAAADDRVVLIQEMKKVDQQETALKKEWEKVDAEWHQLMLDIPNPPAPDVVISKNAAGNQIIRTYGQPTSFDFEPKDYLTLTSHNQTVDIKRAAKVSGTRFGYLKGEVAELALALTRLGFSRLIEEGFTPVLPPVLVGGRAMKAMGYLEHGG